MASSSLSDDIFQFISASVMLLAGVFLLVHQWDMPTSANYIIGFCIILGSVLMVNVLGTKALALVLLGIYFIARGTGHIGHQYLRYSLGIPLVILGIYSIFRLFTGSSNSAN